MHRRAIIVVAVLPLFLTIVGCGKGGGGKLTDEDLNLITKEEIISVTKENVELVKKVRMYAKGKGAKVKFFPKGSRDYFVNIQFDKADSYQYKTYEAQRTETEDFASTINSEVKDIADLAGKAFSWRGKFANALCYWSKKEALMIKMRTHNNKHTVPSSEGPARYVPMDELVELIRIIDKKLETR